MTLDTAVNAVAPVAAQLDVADAGSPASTIHRSRRTSRQGVIPRWQRWEIHDASDNIDVYARQLDHFAIELAAAGGGEPHVDYASGFSGAVQTRSAAPADERRLYMTWTSGTMQALDRALLNRAGIATRGRNAEVGR